MWLTRASLTRVADLAANPSIQPQTLIVLRFATMSKFFFSGPGRLACIVFQCAVIGKLLSGQTSAVPVLDDIRAYDSLVCKYLRALCKDKVSGKHSLESGKVRCKPSTNHH